ncbi:hypothetical protein PoB_002947900, partial [Plakobranchus ocellatus]
MAGPKKELQILVAIRARHETAFAESMTRRPAFCSAFLEKPEGLRQCKMKPLRDSNLCRHH